MNYGLLMLGNALYLTFLVSLVVSLLDTECNKRLFKETLRRWCKFLLGLIVLGFVVQIITWLG